MVQLGIEENLTLLLSKLSFNESDKLAALNMLEEAEVNWAKFYDYIVRHKTVNLVLKNAEEHRIPVIKSQWRRVFQASRLSTELRNQFVYESLLPLLDQFEKAGVCCVPLKGIIINEIVYKDNSLRHSRDFDILVQEKDLTYVTNMLNEYGYIQTLDLDVMEPASKRIRTFHRMSTHELVPFARKTTNKACPKICIDVQFDIFSRAKHTRVLFPLKKLFESTISIPVLNGKFTIKTLRPEYNLLQLTSHMFRDMTRIQDIMASRDLRLIQFVDIYEYIKCFKEEMDWELFVNESVNYGANYMVYYVLYYIEQLFGTIVPIEIMKRLCPDDIRYLDRYGFEEGSTFEWKMPFLERLFNLKRKDELQELDQSKLVESNKYLNALNIL